MQENIQGPVSLAGPGFVYRPNDKYREGEYKRLLNMDITPDGALTNRAPVQGYLHNSATALNRFIGSFSSWAVAVGGSATSDPDLRYIKDYSVEAPVQNYANMYTALDNATSGIAGVRSNKHISLEGFFKYNNKDYLIVHYTFNVDTTKHGALVTLQAPSVDTKTPALVADYTYAGSVIESQKWPVGDYSWFTARNVLPTWKVKNFLIHKERVWIATEDTVYFSAATVPDKYASPDGGFFKFADKSIKKIVALGDIIYVFGDSSIHYIQYNTDPNADATVTLVSDIVGGEDAVLFGDTIFCAKPGEVYEVSGLNVNKVVDLNFGIKRTTSQPISTTPDLAYNFDIQLKAFEGSLYVVPRLTKFLTVASAAEFNPYLVQNNVYQVGAPVTMFKIDANTGAVSEYAFERNGLPVDMHFVGVEDRFNQNKLVVIGYDGANVRVFSFGSRGRLFYDDAPTAVLYDADDYYIDSASKNDGSAFDYIIPPYYMWIRHFSPDNLRHLMKKFRLMSLEADIPTYWDVASATFKPLFRMTVQAGVEEVNTKARQHYTINEILPQDAVSNTYRYGVNQRARHIDIHIGSYTADPPLLANPAVPAANVYADTVFAPPVGTAVAVDRAQCPSFELTYMTTFWTYQGRSTSGPSDNS